MAATGAHQPVEENRRSYAMLPSTVRYGLQLIDLRTILTIVLIWFPVLDAVADDCPLQGKWKSDEARTLANISTIDSLSAGAANAVSQDVFGRVIHEWTCTEFRAYPYDSEPADAVTYRIEGREAEWYVLTVYGATEYELKIALEGACYKVQMPARKFYEYFCPV